MGFLADAFSQKAMTSDQIWLELYGGRKTASGKTVNVSTAIEVSAVLACNRAIGNGMAQPPLKLMRETIADGKRTRLPAKDDPRYNLMAVKPNRWQTSFQWRQMVSWHVELAGNHYSYINRTGKRIVELFPFTPGAVEQVDLGFGEFEYKVTGKDGKVQTFKSKDILHIRGLSWDGMLGLDIVKIAREAIGLAMSSEESASSLHKNKIKSSGVYSVEGVLKEDQHKSLMKFLLENYAGSSNIDKPMIVDRNAKWISTQMTGVDAQALETRKYQIEEICRYFGVMPIMVGYSDKAATYASAEQMFLAHSRDCLAPRWTNYEQAFDTQLLTESDREEGLYFDFVEEGMMRGSLVDTKDMLLGYLNGGVMTEEEVREKLDLNPTGGEGSTKIRLPTNIVGATPPTQPPKSGV